MKATLRENVGVALAITVLACSLGGNAIQYLQEQERANGRSAGFQVGRAFPLLVGTDEDGQTIHMEFGRPTVVYVFSPNCGWCKKDYQNLKALHAGASHRYRFIAIALSSPKAPDDFHRVLRDYVSTYPLPGRRLLVEPEWLDPETARDMRVTPQTIVTDGSGIVQRVWVGALMEKRLAEAERFFAVRLPGITSATEIPE